ncbi:MAG: DUF1992 domain-containing protein [Nitriliruptorales bacterium]|nr:DUF1992 domain-containing protein [Nitriliruptorales bacterium]
MSSRKPAGEDRESWIERQIREAQERGDFDNLPGAGKPLPDLDRRSDELWWVRKKLKEENFSYLPPTLQVRKDLEEARQHIARARSEQDVRQIVADINQRIRDVNRTALNGPPSTVMPLDEEATVGEWRNPRASEDE